MKNTYIILLLIITSCNYTLPINDNRTYKESNIEFELYKNDYYNLSIKYGKAYDVFWIPINFYTMPNNILGKVEGFHLYSEILINPSTWNVMNDINRKFLIFHELGHAIHLYAHRNDNYKNYPLSIMCESVDINNIQLAEMMVECEEEYYFELFTGDSTAVKHCIDYVLGD